jgi:putative selenium-binding protein YdfZ
VSGINYQAASDCFRGEIIMMTYDRNRNAITTGTPVMINSTGTTGKIRAIHSEGLNAAQVRRNKTVEVEGVEGRFEPVELIRLGLH